MHQMLIDIPLKLETERLILRCYKYGDGKDYYSMLNENIEHLKKYDNDRLFTIKSEGEAEIYIRELISDWYARKRFVLGVWEKNFKKFVGEIWIEVNNWEDRIFEIGWFAEKGNTGKGYVTEAAKASLKLIFEVFDGHKVVVTAEDSNQRSYSVAERCGFLKEGHFKEQKRFKDGTWYGTLYYGLLKNEYEKIYY